MVQTAARLELIALPGFPRVQRGDDLGQLITQILSAQAITLQAGDIVVCAQKIVSKAEGRRVLLATVEPSPRAHELAQQTGKDPRLLELILRESNQVVRVGKEVVIVEHRLGFVLANAGVDQSNVSEEGTDDEALLLPVDPDGSAAALRERLAALTNVSVAVVINDSWGRPWRRGVIGQAIGVAGLEAVVDQRGRVDLNGRRLRATDVAIADEVAAAASLLMGQADEGRPVVLVRGLKHAGEGGDGKSLLRPRGEDLFR